MRHLPVKSAQVRITRRDGRAALTALQDGVALTQIKPGVLDETAVAADAIGRDDLGCLDANGMPVVILLGARGCNREGNSETDSKGSYHLPHIVSGQLRRLVTLDAFRGSASCSLVPAPYWVRGRPTGASS